MCTEAEPDLIVIPTPGVVVKQPLRVFCAARRMNQVSKLVVLALPEASHAAVLPVLVPKAGIDVPICGQGRYELIAAFR